MARAAVKAKQQAKAKAQPPKARARGRKRHAGGGNPNQQLFFMKLRRGQKWLYALLAVVFAATFAGVGVGSGTNGLSGLYSGLFGTGGNAVSKAKNEVKKNPAKGYRDLATAYETKSDNVQAITALQSYLGIKKKDANGWFELGGLEASQANTYISQYQAAQQSSQLADPSTPFAPSGTLGTAIGTNAAFQQASQAATTQTSTLFQQATTSLNGAMSDYQKAAKLQPKNPTNQEALATAAENAGNAKVAIGAWNRFLKLSPDTPQKKQIEAHVKQLKQQLTAGKPTVKTGNGKSKPGKK